MSKKYIGKECAYCGKPSVTGDHVVAREFFPEDARDGLPQVPACAACNGAKSSLEHHLATVLPIAGLDDAAAHGRAQKLVRRLDKNRALERTLQDSFNRLDDVAGDGRRAVEFDQVPLLQYMAWVARGLSWYHFEVRIDEDTKVSVRFEKQDRLIGAANFIQALDTGRRAEGHFANGALCYQGVLINASEKITFWYIRIYSGLYFGWFDDGGSFIDGDFDFAVFTNYDLSLPQSA